MHLKNKLPERMMRDMTEDKATKPAILIDLKKCRIRIHKKTLHSIGDPDNILLLVNPEERTLAILCSTHSDPRAHHIRWATLVNKKSFELYSTSLINSLRDICCDWQDNQSYRIYGDIIPSGGVAKFHMADCILVKGVKSI
jgi:hypothetical protein